MSGYYGFSKSNNAMAAEASGIYPLTQAKTVLSKKYNIPPEHAKQWLLEEGPCEKHHSSKYYRYVDYYNTNLDEQEINSLMAFEPEVKNKPQKVTRIGGLEYKVWGGTRRHPKCKTHTYEGEYEVILSKENEPEWYIFNGQRKKCTNVSVLKTESPQTC